MKPKKLITYFLLTFIFIFNISAQELSDMQRKSLNPISPTAYQFLKFGEIPVNEYSGSPAIEIPLFKVDIRGFSLPIKLQYHSKGIRVNEESDWVGLGWDLGFGSVTQMINDKNDLTNSQRGDVPYVLGGSPFGTIYDFWHTTPPEFTNMGIRNDIVDYADSTYSFITFTHNTGYVVDKWNVTGYIDFDFFNKDYEKDIFIANVLGEQLYILIRVCL